MAQIKDLKRMCETYNNCERCPLSCKSYAPPYELPDNADEIVDKWAEGHPVKTYAMDFFEKFPNAPKDKDGEPKACVQDIYSDAVVSLEGCREQSCAECWNEDMK